MWYLHLHQVMRYGGLRRAIADITPKMLTQTLRELEEDHLIRRTVYNEVPPRVEYALTEVGQELIPFIDHLRAWGVQRMQKENIPMIGEEQCVIPG